MAIEAELKRKNASGELVAWQLNDDGTDPVADEVVRQHLENILETLSGALSAVVSGQVSLSPETLTALESVSAIVSGTVSLDEPTLTALETITVGNMIPAVETGLAKDTTLRDVQRSVTDYETRLDYAARTDGNPVYIGKNTQAAATSSAGWTIQKLDYDSLGRLTRAQVLTGSWDNRSTLGWS
jgi:YD repeat-containing protein